MMIGSNNGIIENKSFIVHIYQQEIYIKNDYNLSSLAKWLSVRLRTKWFWVRVQLQKILVLYEKNTYMISSMWTQ